MALSPLPRVDDPSVIVLDPVEKFLPSSEPFIDTERWKLRERVFDGASTLRSRAGTEGYGGGDLPVRR